MNVKTRGVDLGDCCACGGKNAVNVVCLEYLAPMAGTGWGCFQCSLPMDGATAVLCEPCRVEGQVIRWVVVGSLEDGGRLPVDKLAKIPFAHDLSQHPELFPKNNPAASLMVWDTSPDAGEHCLCSYCGEAIMELPIRMFIEGEGETKEVRLHDSCLGEHGDLHWSDFHVDGDD